MIKKKNNKLNTLYPRIKPLYQKYTYFSNQYDETNGIVKLKVEPVPGFLLELALGAKLAESPHQEKKPLYDTWNENIS